MRDKELIEKYIDGSLSKDERHELEKKALRDPMLMDAIEGHQQMVPDLSGGRRGKALLASIGLIGVFTGIAIMWWASEVKGVVESVDAEVEPNAQIENYDMEHEVVEPKAEGIVLNVDSDSLSLEFDPATLEVPGVTTVIDESNWIGVDSSEQGIPDVEVVTEENGVVEPVNTKPVRVLNLNPYLSQTINEQKLMKIKAENNAELSNKELKRAVSHADQIVAICELIRIGKTTEADSKIFMYKKSSVSQDSYFTWLMALKELKLKEIDEAKNRLIFLSKEPTSLGIQAKKLYLELNAVE